MAEHNPLGPLKTAPSDQFQRGSHGHSLQPLCICRILRHILKKTPNEFAKTNDFTKSIQYTHIIHVFPTHLTYMIINAGKE